MNRSRVNHVMENYVYTGVAILTLIFWIGYSQLSSRNFLLILNAVYSGQMMAVITIYATYFFYVLFSHEPYSRGRQYVITTGLQHLAYILVVYYSVSNRKFGSAPTLQVDLSLLLSRYVVLVAGFLQMTAPDLGKPFLYGFNRKVLWMGSGAGVLVALVVLWVQFSPGILLPFDLEEVLGLGD